MRLLQSLAMLLGRACISVIFLLAAFHKITDWNSVSEYMASKGMTYIPFFLFAAACLEFFGGLSLLLGLKSRIGVLLLLIMLIPATAIFHDFWNLDGSAKELQMIMFLKNLAIVGGLLQILACGSGLFSLDYFFRRKTPLVES